MKAFLIDLDKCVGCHDCQIGCKDEHCGNEWMPYAKEQPWVGQFWLKVNQLERGKKPHVKLTYMPVLCQHCDNAPCIKAAPDAVTKREDGLVIIDPIKAEGNKQLVDSCPYGVIYWNEELNIPQKCTGCAHLIDRGWPISVPRCFDNCHVDAILFGEESELDLDGAEVLHPEYGTKPRVWYKGLPKRFIAGTVYDPDAKEVVIGAKVLAANDTDTFETATDDWGDFWLWELPESDFSVTISSGARVKTIQTSTKKEDIGLGDIALI